MSFQERLRALIETRTTPAEAGASAMPNVGVPNRFTITQSPYDYVAPENGYLCVESVSSADANEVCLLCGELKTSSTSSLNFGCRVFLPVKKGITVQSVITGYDMTRTTAFFFPTMGGGKSKVARYGGGVCTLTASAPYSGFLAGNRSQAFVRQQRASKAPAKTSLAHRQSMGGATCNLTHRIAASRCSQRTTTSSQARPPQWSARPASASLCERVRPSRSGSRAARPQPFGGFSLSGNLEAANHKEVRHVA